MGRLHRSELFHYFAYAVVGCFGWDHLVFHVLITPRAVTRGRHAFLAQPQRAAAISPRRDSHQRAAVNRGHFDFCAQRGFAHRDRDFSVDVVAAPLEKWMRPYLYAQIQIARRRAHRPGVAFARNTQARTVGQSRRNPHVDCFRAAHAPFSAARLAGRTTLSAPAATRAWNVEAHLAGSLLDGSAAVANRASLRRADRARAVAGFAGVEPRNL